MWFYFNFWRRCSINIYRTLYIPIWFYFNFIRVLYPIHSCILYIPIWFYFNEACQKACEFIDCFTFQYGSTLIACKVNQPRTNNLYIPIWFYFNLIIAPITMFFTVLYIPIWFYFNILRH